MPKLDLIPLYSPDKPDHRLFEADAKTKYTIFSKCIIILSICLLFTTIAFLYFERDKNYSSYNELDHDIRDLEKNLRDFLKNKSKNIEEPQCSNIRNEDKFDCNPDRPSTKETCLQRGCCWSPLQHDGVKDAPGIPYCYYPTNYEGYKITNITLSHKKTEIYLKRNTSSGLPRDIKNINVTIIEHPNAVEIKVTDLDATRYESFYPQLNPPDPSQSDLPPRPYRILLTPSGRLSVVRGSATSTPLFQTELSQLVFADQFLQLTTALPSANVYGLAEHMSNLRLNSSWHRYTLLNSDLAPTRNKALYGSHPFYLALEEGGSASGLALINSNIMDIVLQPAPAVTFRPIGGILHFLVLAGPSPRDVVRQLSDWVGRPDLPPYWSLGFHLCRFGYETLNNTRAVLERNRKAGIPLDVQWNDIDYMIRQNDFTYDPTRFAELPEFVKQLHQEGLRYVIMTDPGISGAEPSNSYPPYDDGIKSDIFLKNSSGQILIAKVWNPVSTVFPDFTHPNITDYWTKQISTFHQSVPFDGLWIDMNEPSNFDDGSKYGCPNSPLDHPPYSPGDQSPIYHKTACMSARHFTGNHYDLHNLYGITESDVTNSVLRKVIGKRPFIISRSTFLGHGRYSGHWTGDVFSTWDDMRMTIPGMLNFGLVGVPLVGADICGFNGNTTVELCARWSSLGAFYPFSRNHNTDNGIAQDPVALGPKVVAAARNALLMRYYLLPYIYSQLVLAHTQGDALPRPLFLEFPQDVSTYDLQSQFLLGPAIMVIPALYPGLTKVEAYFPAGRWYDLQSYQQLTSRPGQISLPAPLDKINLAVRGGFVLPCQPANLTTSLSRKNPFVLMAALDDQDQASGELFWDDGESLDTYQSGSWSHFVFHVTKNRMTISPTQSGFTQDLPPVQDVLILGLQTGPSRAEVNGVPTSFEYNSDVKTLLIHTNLNLLAPLNTVEWNFASQMD